MEKSIHKIYRRLAVVVLTVCGFFLSSKEANAQQVAVKTNALYWACMTPNIGCEIVTGEHTSLDLSASGHWQPYNLPSKLVTIQPEFRYWFNGRPMTREFVGVTSMIAAYDMTVAKKYVYDGNAVMLGLVGGYVFALSDHWNFELCGGFGLLGFKQKQYYINDNYDDYFVDEAVKANSMGYKLFPARLGVSFSYIIK
jgi:hypothetical protein